MKTLSEFLDALKKAARSPGGLLRASAAAAPPPPPPAPIEVKDILDVVAPREGRHAPVKP